MYDAIIKCGKILDEQGIPDNPRYIIMPKWMLRRRPTSKKKRIQKKYLKYPFRRKLQKGLKCKLKSLI